MVAPKLRSDLKKLAQIKSIDQLKKQLVGYEKRVLEIVRDVDLKGREARRKGEQKINQFAEQLRRQSTGIEKQVRVLVAKERERLNEGIFELVTQLRKLSGSETVPVSAPVKKTTAKPPKTSKTENASGKRSASSSKPKRKSVVRSTSRSAAPN